MLAFLVAIIKPLIQGVLSGLPEFIHKAFASETVVKIETKGYLDAEPPSTLSDDELDALVRML